MLEILRPRDPDAARRLNTLLSQRQDSNATIGVQDIVEAVRSGGDAALLDFTAQFDHIALKASDLRVAPEDIASATIDPLPTAAMQRAAERIEAFHRHEQRNDWWTVSADGALLGQRFLPMNSVGVYVPGGAAPYASSLLMNVIPARIAGVPRIVAATPPGPDGEINPSILVAARLCGIDEMYRVGGAQAIAALAYGTPSIPRVAKIVGPGNAYVAAAKRLVYGDVGIDTIAGPSEVAILADASADPRLIAADLIAQAEHDDAFVLIVTTEPKLLSMISAEIEAQMPSLDRAATIRAALADSIAIVTEDLAEAIDWINRIGPEHLELFVADPLAVVLRIQSAGVILCGPYAPAAVCDYGIGPNHVLPTGGTGRFASALGVDDFLRRVSVVSVTRDAFSAIARDGIALAEVEGLTAHAAALRIRLEDLR